MSVLRKLAAQLKAEGGFVPPSDDKFHKAYPGLWEFLTVTVYPEEGGPRENGTLMVFCEEGSWKLCLNDRSSEASAWLTASTFEGLFKAAERGLQDGGLDWRKKRSTTAPKKR